MLQDVSIPNLVDAGMVLPETSHRSFWWKGGTVTFEMTEVTSVEDIQSALGISASTSGGGRFSASAKMNYTQSCHFHSSSVFLMVSINVLQAFSSIKAPTMDPAAAAMLAQGQTSRFQDMYGDMFVRGLVAGGQFFGVIEVSTSSQTDQESLSVSLSGSYGMFNASGSVSQSFSKAIENRSVKISCFIQGGQTSPVPTTVEDMVAMAKTWPGSLVDKGCPTRRCWTATASWICPTRPTIDLQNQKDVLEECSRLRNQDWLLQNEIDFIVAHPEQFIGPVDLPGLATYRNQLSADLKAIAVAASLALNAPKSAAVPTLSAIPLQLPRRVDGQPLEMVTIPNWGGTQDVEQGGTDANGNVVVASADGSGLKVEFVYSQTGQANMGDELNIAPPAGTQVISGSTIVVTIQRNPEPHDN